MPRVATDIATFERAAARAWPSARTEPVAGWLWRGSGGGARRANSVLPLGYDGDNLDAAIDAVEVLYRGQNTKCYFQVSSASSPPELDVRLAARGYTSEEPCLLMVKHLTSGVMPSDIAVSDDPDTAWLDVFAELLDPMRRATTPKILDRVPPPRAFFSLLRDSTTIATALGVVDPVSRTVTVECVATHTSARRSGAARIIMDGLESWAHAQGAETAILQVVEGNAPARALYINRGYQTAGQYHYRWRDV